jgi:serine phosphatase RsbU (regulator of sigma subunit)
MQGVSQDITETREAQAALEAAREELYESELHRIRERHRVDTLQEAVLPSELVDVPWLEVDASYTPATPDLAVGGDWYDVFPVGPERVAFAVGDVSGHGIEAAALMGQLRNALRAYALEEATPPVVMERLNRLLCRLDVDSFATAVFGVVTPDAVELAVAGHPSPVVFGPDGARLWHEARGPLLGVSPDQAYTAAARRLEPGRGLLVYTDGLVERRGEHIDDGLARLVAAVGDVAEKPIDGLCDDLVHRLVPAHAGRDDVCQVLLRVPGRSAP